MRTQKYLPLRGRTDGLEPAAGDVGEYLTAVLAAGAATALVTSTPKTIVSLPHSAGDWDTWGAAGFLPAATTNVTLQAAGISGVDNTLPAQDDGTRTDIPSAPYVPGANVGCRLPVAMRRLLTAAPSTLFLIGVATFTVSTMSAYGRIQARRRS
jgi:hypothetical protein